MAGLRIVGIKGKWVFFPNTPLLQYSFSLCVLVLPLFAGCGAQSKALYRTDVSYQRKGFTGNELHGRSVFVFPVMNRSGVDSSSQKILMEQTEWIQRNRKDMTFFFGDTFANIYERRYGDGSWAGLCKNLFEGEVMVLQTNDRFWRLFKNEYILILRMNSGIRIRTFEGKQTQRVRLESELWCKDSAEVFWRAQTAGYSTDSTTVDRVFIRDAIREVFSSMPKAHGPVDNEKEW